MGGDAGGLPADGSAASPSAAAGAPADRIKIRDVDADQGTTVRVVESGFPLPAEARTQPLLRGTPMRIVGSWAFVADWRPRVIRAQLHVTYGDGQQRFLQDTKMVAQPSDPNVPERTFSWQLAADDVQVGMAFSIELYEGDGFSGTSMMTPPSRLPTHGVIPMGLSD